MSDLSGQSVTDRERGELISHVNGAPLSARAPGRADRCWPCFSQLYHGTWRLRKQDTAKIWCGTE